MRREIAIEVSDGEWKASIGTIRSATAFSGGRELGGVGFIVPEHVIYVELNLGHPGIRAAATTADEETLSCYIGLLCGIRLLQVKDETGEYPWPHEGWPEFILACKALSQRVGTLMYEQ